MIAKFLLGALAALALGSAAQAQNAPAAAASPWDNIHTVAIVSGIGTALQLREDHSFSADTKQLDITDWSIDAQVAAALHQYLTGRFTFTDVKYDPTAVAQIPSGAWDSSDHGTRAFAGTLSTDGVDAFIIVRPSTEKDGPAGLALENRNAIDPRPVEWANYEIDIVDAKTFTLLAHAQSRLQSRIGSPVGVAALMGEKSLNPAGDLSLTDAQRAALQMDFTRLVSQSLIDTVRALNLNVSLPDVGARSVVPIPAGQDPFASIKKIAIASAIGDQLSMRQWATITLTDKDVPIADWNLDSEIEALAKTAMGTRFTIVNANIDRAALESAPLVDAQGHVATSFPGLQPSNDVDAYVLFVKMPLADEAGGVGMQHSETLFVEGPQTDLFANYAVAVIDAHTLRPIVIDKATTSPKMSAPTPTLKVDNAMWPAQVGTLTPEEAAKIHQALSNLLGDSVPETLLRMELTGMTISGAPSQAAAH